MLELRRISKRFGATDAVCSVDLDVPRAHTTALIGPSGSGKSTLLRVVNGLVVPEGGEILLDARPVQPWRDLAVRRRMGYVIQEGGLFPHLTVRGNVAIQARHLGWSRDRIDDRIVSLLELVRLEVDLLQRFPGELSGGQRQRVSLMRALMLDPELLLLDEPLGALDPMIRSDLQEDLRSIFRSVGKTVVLVTHDLVEAGFFADRVVLLDEGRIAQQGTLADLIERPASDFVRRFVSAQRGGLVAGGSP